MQNFNVCARVHFCEDKVQRFQLILQDTRDHCSVSGGERKLLRKSSESKNAHSSWRRQFHVLERALHCGSRDWRFPLLCLKWTLQQLLTSLHTVVGIIIGNRCENIFSRRKHHPNKCMIIQGSDASSRFQWINSFTNWPVQSTKLQEK